MVRKGRGILFIPMPHDQSSHLSFYCFYCFYFVVVFVFHKAGKSVWQRHASERHLYQRDPHLSPLSVSDTGPIKAPASTSLAPWRPPLPTASQREPTARTWGMARPRPTV